MKTAASTASAITEAQIDSLRKRIQHLRKHTALPLAEDELLIDLFHALAAPTTQPTGQGIRVRFDDNDLVEWDGSIPDGVYTVFPERAAVEPSQPAAIAKVYIVSSVCDYEGGTTIAAFVTREQAEAFIAECEKYRTLKPTFPEYGTEADTDAWWAQEIAWQASHPAGQDNFLFDRYAVHTLEIRGASRTPAPAALEWQPIETAPKDGSEFLAYTDERTLMVLFWSFDRWTDGVSHEIWGPTHWMPLPDYPAAIAASTQAEQGKEATP